MFGIGGGELLVIVLVALLVFGPSRLPEIARTLKRVMQELSRIRQQVDETVGDLRQELDLRLEEEDPRPAQATANTPPALPPASAPAPPSRSTAGPPPRSQVLPVAEEDDYLVPAPSAPATAANQPEAGAGDA